MLRTLKPMMGLFILLSLITGVVYPIAVTMLASVAFPHQAKGSLIVEKGQVIGSELIGQAFSDPGHFWGRPSSTAPNAYNGAASSGSNLGPLNPALISAVQERIDTLKQYAHSTSSEVPVDLVTSSASGLDPDESVAAALYQVPRIAKARGVSESRLAALVQAHARTPYLGILGEPRVNVLDLNRALDALYPHRHD